jgi:hypothetical protein
MRRVPKACVESHQQTRLKKKLWVAYPLPIRLFIYKSTVISYNSVSFIEKHVGSHVKNLSNRENLMYKFRKNMFLNNFSNSWEPTFLKKKIWQINQKFKKLKILNPLKFCKSRKSQVKNLKKCLCEQFAENTLLSLFGATQLRHFQCFWKIH